jgi:hypothetical protein
MALPGSTIAHLRLELDAAGRARPRWVNNDSAPDGIVDLSNVTATYYRLGHQKESLERAVDESTWQLRRAWA